ncbi:putative helicase [Prevotella sp. CAG:732]|nr:putative helicase [Prevotella sp. CAG:732]
MIKISIIHTNKKNQLVLNTKNFESFLQRIAKDDARGTITNFRNSKEVLDYGYESYRGMANWRHVYPSAEYGKEANDCLKLKTVNGILLLTFDDIFEAEDMAALKRSASLMPSTFAVIEGADGTSAHVLVRYTDIDGEIPQNEEDAEELHRMAAKQIVPLYQTLIKEELQPTSHSLKDNFLMTLDAHPYYNAQAIPMKIDHHVRKQEMIKGGVKEVKKFPTPDLVGWETDDGEIEKSKVGVQPTTADNIMNMMVFLRDRYDFRYNVLMKYTEYKTKGSWHDFAPVDPRVQKRMTLDVQLADIRVSIKDVRNFLESDYIANYDPIDEYLFQCEGKWDGKDHIRALARTVPTANPHWADWFYIWYLGMVDQWRGINHRLYGNSVAPLLISKQGFNKSTFCRRLIPQELQWGYTDNLVLSEKRQVYQAMAQTLLINLDEFNQISPQVQQGFLKNLIQLPNVKMKRPYGGHVEEFPRLASFIATSNMDDILTDPSGNRRFIGVELTGPIDVSVKLNYVQLFAQAMAAIRAGEKTYFDSVETALLMQSNRQFEVVPPIEQYFQMCFDLVEDESQGKYMSAAEIFDYLKKRIGSSLKIDSLMSFGRKLANIDGIKVKRFATGKRYLVAEKETQKS